jgi:hypothetical protein
MTRFALFACACLALSGAPLRAQDGAGEIIVTGTRIRAPGGGVLPVQRPPVIGLKRQADSALRLIEIVSDSREEDMRKREVQAMLLAAIDRAKRDGLSLVVGDYEVVEVTRENWQDRFPALAGKASAADDEDDDDDEDEDDDNKPKPVFEDDGSTATARLMVKARLTGSISDAQQKIRAFVKSVPATGRSLIAQRGGVALTIINPEQYRDEIYGRIAKGAKNATGFYGAEYGATVTGLDREIAWTQVSNIELFLYIPYSFTVAK